MIEAIAGYFVVVTPVAAFIGICTRLVRMLVSALSGGEGLM